MFRKVHVPVSVNIKNTSRLFFQNVKTIPYTAIGQQTIQELLEFHKFLFKKEKRIRIHLELALQKAKDFLRPRS